MATGDRLRPFAGRRGVVSRSSSVGCGAGAVVTAADVAQTTAQRRLDLAQRLTTREHVRRLAVAAAQLAQHDTGALQRGRIVVQEHLTFEGEGILRVAPLNRG
jgi:hypothetical protein